MYTRYGYAVVYIMPSCYLIVCVEMRRAEIWEDEEGVEEVGRRRRCGRRCGVEVESDERRRDTWWGRRDTRIQIMCRNS